VVEVVGDAFTVAPVVAFRPVPGDQAKVVPPVPELAVRATAVGGQYSAELGVTDTPGAGLTVMVTGVAVTEFKQASDTVRV